MNLMSSIATSMLAIQTSGDKGGGLWMPPSGSTIAETIDWMFFFIYWICVFFFVLICAIMVWFIVKYRRGDGRKAEVTSTHNTPLELTWTIIPLILVIAIFYMGLDGYVDMTGTPKNAYEVNVVGQQWSWQFNHRNGVSDANLLTVPVRRPVKLIMTSQDVLHSVFIPAFRVKQDAVPGRYTYLWFEAKEPGTYQLFCSEYCGTEHSQMTARVEVLEHDEFEAAMTKRANILDELTIADYPAYFLKYLYPRCVSCHNLDETPKQGPGFGQTHRLWGQSRVMDDGREVTVDENYIRKSMLNPQADVVANMTGKMVTFQGQISDKQVTAIIEFMKRLNEVVDEQGKPIAQ